MPIAIPRRRSRSLAVAVTAVALLIGAVVPTYADAASGCASTPTVKAFRTFGDTADYSLVSNGAFESGTSGWSLTRASVASGNEPWKVHGSGDAKSLAIQSTGTVVSPAFCVSGAHPSFRFFARRTGGTWGVLYANLRYTDAAGQVREVNVGALSGDPFTSWAPSQSLPLATTLPLWEAGSTLKVRLVFDLEDTGGAFTIDDVYIDPYRR